MNFFKGLIVAVAILVILIGLNVICNMNDFHLDTVATGTSAAIIAMFAYVGLTKKKAQ